MASPPKDEEIEPILGEDKQLSSSCDVVSTSASTSQESITSALARHAAALRVIVWNSGEACILIASVFFSLNSLFVKLLQDDIPIFQIVLFRSIFSFMVCSYVAWAGSVAPFWGHPPHRLLLLMRGLFGAAAMTCYYVSLTLLPLADAVTLFFLNPAVTAVAAWLIMHEPMGLVGAAGVMLSVVGLVVLTHPPIIFGSRQPWGADRVLGTFNGLLAAFLAAGAFISIRKIGSREPALVMSIYFHSIAAFTSFLPLCVGVPEYMVIPDGTQSVLLLAIGALSFGAQMVLGRGFQLLVAAKAGAINFSQVVFSYILGMLFLHEQLRWFGPVGSVLVACGTVMVNWRQQPGIGSTGDTPTHGNASSMKGVCGGRGCVGGDEEQAVGLLPFKASGVDGSEGKSMTSNP